MYVPLKYDKMEQKGQMLEAPLSVCKAHRFVGFFPVSVKTEYNVVDSIEFLVQKVKAT